eukprot:6167817-Amphidinium_carterae.1
MELSQNSAQVDPTTQTLAEKEHLFQTIEAAKHIAKCVPVRLLSTFGVHVCTRSVMHEQETTSHQFHHSHR